MKLIKKEIYEDGFLTESYYKLFSKDNDYIYTFRKEDLEALEQEIIRVKSLNK